LAAWVWASDIVFLFRKERRFEMNRYECTLCGFVYNEAEGYPEGGIAPGTKWEDLPADWVCPLCGASKDDFEKL
jgi:rubredoxin